MRLNQAETSRLRGQMMEFCRRVLAGQGTAEELAILPQVLALLTGANSP